MSHLSIQTLWLLDVQSLLFYVAGTVYVLVISIAGEKGKVSLQHIAAVGLYLLKLLQCQRSNTSLYAICCYVLIGKMISDFSCDDIFYHKETLHGIISCLLYF